MIKTNILNMTKTINEAIDFDELDEQKITLVKPQLRTKWQVWMSFLFFGWSYGSFGKLGVQILWYVVPLITAFGFYEFDETKQFTVFTSMAVVGFGVWIGWGIARILTLNKAIRQYNKTIANFYGLTNDERRVLGIK